MRHHRYENPSHRLAERIAWIILSTVLVVTGGGFAHAYANAVSAYTDQCTRTAKANGGEIINCDPIAAPSPSPSASASPSPEPSPSVSPSASPTPPPSPSPSPTTPSPSPTQTGTLKNCFGDVKNSSGPIDQGRLGQCGYPTLFTTGIPPATVITAYQGPMNVTTSTTVIDGKRIPCGMDIHATNVVIRNSLITGTGFWCIQVYGNGSLTIQDSEINCTNGSGTGLWGPNFKATRLYIHDCENALEINANSQLVDSYLVAREGNSNAHGDDIQSQGGNNVTIRHNTFAGLNPITSSIITNPTANNSWLVELNFFSAGAYTLYCPEQGINFIVRNNRFYWPVGGYASDPHRPAYGLYDACVGNPGVTLTGNFRDSDLVPA